MIRAFPLESIATPLITEIFREVLEAGGHPHIAIDLESIRYLFLTEASEHQLLHPDFVPKKVAEEFDVNIGIGCDSNTHSLTSVKPEAWGWLARAYSDISDAWSRRTASGELRWVVSRFPTHAYAQDANMSLIEFGDFFITVALPTWRTRCHNGSECRPIKKDWLNSLRENNTSV